METSAIDAIAALATAGQQVFENAVLVPERYELRALEQFSDRPYRQRGTFKTRLIPEFVGYCDEWHTDETRIFIDPAAMTATARIDHGDADYAGWAEHRAVLDLERSPAYAALQHMTGRALSQQELVDYWLDWMPQLTFSSAEPGEWSDMAATAAVQAIRTMKVEAGRVSTHSEHDTSRERSLLEQAAVTSRPPAGFSLRCHPYRGLTERTVVVRLSYKPEDPPKIVLRILEEEALNDALASEFQAELLARHDESAGGIAAGIHVGAFV